MFCIPTTLYINPFSGSLTELGTREHPFKDFAIPFLLIQNFMTFQDVTVNILVIEDSISYVSPDIAFFVHMNTVTFDTFTDTLDAPDSAKLIFESGHPPSFSPKSKFVLLSDLTSNKATIVANPVLSALEALELSEANMGFHIGATNLMINNMELVSTVMDPNFIMFNPAYLEDKTLTLTQVSTSGYGGILKSISPLNLQVTNLIVDYFQNSHGFDIEINCEYTTATTLNELVFDNIQIMNSETRTEGVTGSFLSLLGDANITITNSNFSPYGVSGEDFSPVVLNTTSECNPSDSVLQKFLLQNLTFTMMDTTQHSQIQVGIDETYNRNIEIMVDTVNMTESMTDPANHLISMDASSKTQITVRNTDLNVDTFSSSVYVLKNALSVQLVNMNIHDINDFGSPLIDLAGIETVSINNVTIEKCNSNSENMDYYIHYNTYPGQLSIEGLTMQDLDGGHRVPIQLTLVDDLKIKDSVIQNVVTTTPIISSPMMKTIDVDGLSFINVTGSILFDMTGFNLEGSETLSLKNIVATSTTTPALNIQRVSNHNGTAASFTIENFQYLNSTFGQFDTPTTLFVFEKLQHDFDFDIIINDCIFSGLEYGLIEQYIFEFRHQTKNGVQVNNLRVEDTVNVHILFSATVPSNRDLPTIVTFNNLTTNNVNGYITSFMQMEAGCRIYVLDSTLSQIFNFETGAVFHGRESDSQIMFNDTIIQQNSALEAAVFRIQQSSLVILHGCTVQFNFAPDIGVLTAEDDGKFEFYNTTFSGNYGARVYFASLSVVTTVPIIEGCTFPDYEDTSVASIIDLLQKDSPGCLHLCFVPATMRTFLLDNQARWNSADDLVMFKMILSEIQIYNNNFTNQKGLIDSFISTIHMENSTIVDTLIEGNIMALTNTQLLLVNTNMNNINQTAMEWNIFYSTMDSVINITNLVVTNSYIQVFSLGSTELYAYDIQVLDSRSMSRLLSFNDMDNVVMENWVLDTFTPENGWEAIDIRRSHVSLMNNCTLSGFTSHMFQAVDSQIDLMDNMVFEYNNAL